MQNTALYSESQHNNLSEKLWPDALWKHQERQWHGQARPRQLWRGAHLHPPVRHLLPLSQHPPGPQLNGHIQPAAEVGHHALFLQQNGHPVDGGDVVHTDHLGRRTEQERGSQGSFKHSLTASKHLKGFLSKRWSVQFLNRQNIWMFLHPQRWCNSERTVSRLCFFQSSLPKAFRLILRSSVQCY